MHESNEPRWRRPAVNSVRAVPPDPFSDPFVMPLPARRLCANLDCRRVLASLNNDVLCFHCQDLGSPRRLDRRQYGLRQTQEKTHAR